MPFFEKLARWLTTRRPTTLGGRGEEVAARRLRTQGMKMVEQNWRCPGGEVDLIAWDGPTLVFIEVKTRRGERATPEEQVGPQKQRRLRRAADFYCRRFKGDPPHVRFDVVAVVWAERTQPHVRHHKGAFDG